MNKEEFSLKANIVYNFYNNGIKNGRFPHAVLLYGDVGTRVEEVASYLGKSLLCENDDFACNVCKTCTNFDKNTLHRFVLIDGREASIKKDAINEISEKFSLTFGSEDEIAVYMIYEITSLTGEASNALLKFLEEPPSGVYAILTTNRKEKVIPTIISRVVCLKVLDNDNVNYRDKESYLIHKMNLNFEQNSEELNQFELVLDIINEFFDSYLYTGIDKTINILMQKGGALKGNLCYNYLYGILYEVFLDILESNDNSPFKDVVIGLKNKRSTIYRATKFLEEITSQTRLNFNANLVLGKLAYILEGKNE